MDYRRRDVTKSCWLAIDGLTSTVKKWLAPPVFQGDDEKTRRASFLNEVICINLLFGALVKIGRASCRERVCLYV
jgi:hypothetical protein